MLKLLTIVPLFVGLVSSFASADVLDGKEFCRPVISQGLFGQPKGPRNICLRFSGASVRDDSSTLGGNAPMVFPYALYGDSVTINSVTYEVSQTELREVSGDHVGLVYVLNPSTVGEMPPPMSWISGSIDPKSLATKDQLKFLQEVVIAEIRSNRDDDASLKIINANLALMGLPVIGVKPDIEILNGNGFIRSLEGATIKDKAHKYCLPCSAGLNQFEFGITDPK